MDGSRWIAIASLGAAACVPHFDARAHLGRDGEPWGAHLLQLGHGHAVAHGVVTARGGDGTDWVAFAVDDSGCHHSDLALSLRWKSPRPGLRLGLAVYDARLHRVRARLGQGNAVLTTLTDAPSGHYFAKVFAPGADDAGAYVLRVDAAPSDCAPPELPMAPPIHAARPASHRAPVVQVPWDHVVAEIQQFDSVAGAWQVGAIVMAGTANGLSADWTGTLIDDSGHPYPGGDFAIAAVDVWTSTVRFQRPERIAAAITSGLSLWTVDLSPPPPAPSGPTPAHAPVDAAMTRFDSDASGGTTIELDRGRADGIEIGWRGMLVHPSGVAVPGSAFVIIDVELHHATGLASSLVLTDKDSLHAVVAPGLALRLPP